MPNGTRPFWRALVPTGPRARDLPARFTPEEVAWLLATGDRSPRAQALWRCVARPADWLPLAPDIRRCPQRFYDHLPRIVFWYGQGEALADIERRLGRWSPAPGQTSWALEQAFAEACRRIAGRLNAAPRDYGL
jgi:hypothetical protein